MHFKRRLGMAPRERGDTTDRDGSPDIWELDTGQFAVIGVDMTAQLASKLPPEARCAPTERIVVITRQTLTSARRDIPVS